MRKTIYRFLSPLLFLGLLPHLTNALAMPEDEYDFDSVERAIERRAEEEALKAWRNRPRSLFKEPVVWMEQKQQNISTTIFRLTNYVDNFFGANRMEDEANGSRVKVSFSSLYADGEDPFYDTYIKTKIVLPHTQKRLNLVLESFGESKTEENRASVNIDREREDYGAGLRYSILSSENWDFNTDGGIKIKDPLEPFARVRARNRMKLGPFEARTTQAVFWEESDGWGESTTFVLDKPFWKWFIFRIYTDLTHRQATQRFDFNHSYSVFHRISRRDALAYSAGLTSYSEPTVHLASYQVSVDYRRDIHKGWLFLNLTPGGQWARSRSFVFLPTFQVRLELLFGG